MRYSDVYHHFVYVVVFSARLFLGYSPSTIVLFKSQLIRIGYHCSLIAIIGYLWARPCFWAQFICYHCHLVCFLSFVFIYLDMSAGLGGGVIEQTLYGSQV